MTEEGNKYKTIPAMTPPVVHDYLRNIGRNWTGKGVAIELGSWLGASAAPLLEGLVEAGYDRYFYSFDRWYANSEQVEKAGNEGVKLEKGQDLLPVFIQNVQDIYSGLRLYKGDITERVKEFPGEKIEICLFDAPKMEPVFSKAINAVLPYFIPGVTILGLLDYLFYMKKTGVLRKKLMAPVYYMYHHKDNFQRLAEWPDQCSCVFFKYVKKI